MNTRNTPQKKISLLKQLRGVFVLGVSFLIVSLIFFQSFNQKILNGIVEAYVLDGGIISIGHLQESLGKLDKTLQAAEQKKNLPEVHKLYLKQYQDVSTLIQELLQNFKDFKSATKHITEAQSSIEEINRFSNNILSSEWNPIQFRSYILNIKQHQIEASESLSRTAIEFRSLLNKTYNRIQSKKHQPFILGLILTLVLSLLLGLLSSTIFRRVRLFISNHVAATNKIAKGSLDTRVPIVQNDELGHISFEFNKMAENLQVTKNELERSNQDLEDFAYTASHDLQTPLRHISAFSEMIAKNKDSASKKDLDLWADNIKVSTNNVIHLIDDLLRFSKVGMEGMEKEDVSPDSLLEEIILHCKQSHPTLAIEKSRLPGIKAYKSLIYLVFQNLIDNAAKYGPKNQNPKVSIRTTDSPEQIQFMISDNGPGVPDEQKERVFGLFRRLHADEDVKGSGAGLAICRKIIDHHGGRIWVEDNHPQGSVFCFTIPK